MILPFLWSPNLYAQKAVDKEISLIYHKLGDKNQFAESDFKGTKLLVTKKNLDKVMKALAKGFKYNFFADRAEEL